MERLLRAPISWLIAGESIVVAALLIASWHLFSAVPAPRPAVAVIPPKPTQTAPLVTTTVSPVPSAQPSPLRPSASAPAPGLGRDPAFVAKQLGDVNRDQQAWEEAQWRLSKTLIDAGRTYIEKVVVPAVERAERSAPGGSR